MKSKTYLIYLCNKVCSTLLLLLYISAILSFIVPIDYTDSHFLNSFFIVSIFLLTGLLLAGIYYLLSQFSHNIEKIIDDIINGKTIPPRMEEETLFSQIYHQLYQLQYILNSTNNKAIEERQNLQLLISDISHQVKTPITNLSLLLSSFKQYDLTTEEKTMFVDMMSVQLNKITSLLESMIKTSRLENGIITLRPSLHPLTPSLLKAVKEILPSLNKKNIRLVYSFQQEYMCCHDPKWCTEAFFNILDNAVKYTPENGEITIQVAHLHTYTQIIFSDTGIGIPSQEYTKIFQRFYRSPNVHNEAGVGLGLYLARNIISQQNGYITVASQPDEGTSFTVLLPNK